MKLIELHASLHVWQDFLFEIRNASYGDWIRNEIFVFFHFFTVINFVQCDGGRIYGQCSFYITQVHQIYHVFGRFHDFAQQSGKCFVFLIFWKRRSCFPDLRMWRRWIFEKRRTMRMFDQFVIQMRSDVKTKQYSRWVQVYVQHVISHQKFHKILWNIWPMGYFTFDVQPRQFGGKRVEKY